MNASSAKSIKEFQKLGELLDSIIQKDLAQLIELIKQGVDVNGYEDESLIRPIHFAAQYFPAAVEYLILAGADPSLKTQDGYTALDMARINKNDTLIDFLENKLCCCKLKSFENQN